MKKQPSFEQSLTTLDDIVNKLEDRSVSLEEAMGLFEKGVLLIDKCEKELDQAQQRVTMLSEQTEKKETE